MATFFIFDISNEDPKFTMKNSRFNLAKSSTYISIKISGRCSKTMSTTPYPISCNQSAHLQLFIKMAIMVDGHLSKDLRRPNPSQHPSAILISDLFDMVFLLKCIATLTAIARSRARHGIAGRQSAAHATGLPDETLALDGSG